MYIAAVAAAAACRRLPRGRRDRRANDMRQEGSVCVSAPLVAAGFGDYVRLRTGGGSDGNVYHDLRGLWDFWGPCLA